jgi:PDZ domain-containing secreted protein
MAFTRSTLQRVGAQNDNSPSIFTYKTADTLATVDASGYFNTATAPEKSAADILKVGDFIIAYTSTGPAAGIAIVTSNTRDITATPPVQGVVNVSNFTPVGTINSD